MDIMNRLTEKKFLEFDDLLAFISIYDDKKRTRAYNNMLARNKSLIRGRICVEAGCGMGLITEALAGLGAKKVYAIEKNPHLFALSRQRLAPLKNVEVLHMDIRDFTTKEPVDLLLHEFYGQMLFDEDLYVLEKLKFRPARVLPDGGALKCGAVDTAFFKDPVVNGDVVKRLSGVLVSGLFDEKRLPLANEVVRFQPGKRMPRTAFADIRNLKGDLLYFGIEVLDGDRVICRSGECGNWSYVWTSRFGDRFSLSFPADARTGDPVFKWIG
jgi:SAM-dependent methyltransferase